MGKIISVHVSSKKPEIQTYPSSTAYNLQLLPSDHSHKSVTYLVNKDLSHNNVGHQSASVCKETLTPDEARLIRPHVTDQSICPTELENVDNAKNGFECNSTWHDSLMLEFEETFKYEVAESSQVHAMEVCSKPTDTTDEQISAHIGKSLVRKRLLSQLNTSQCSPAGAPRSRPRVYSPCHHPATSTPRQASRKPSCTHSLFNSTLDVSLAAKKSHNDVATDIGKENNSEMGNNDLSGDLFSDLTESLTLLSFNENSCVQKYSLLK